MKNLFTKDNFWNFFPIPILGLSTALSIYLMMPLIFLASMLFTPIIIKHKQNVTLTSENIFLDSELRPLNDKYPTKLYAVLTLCFIFIFLFDAPLSIFLNIFDIKIEKSSIELIGCFLALLCFISYFLILDCPLSILFHRKAWLNQDVVGLDIRNLFNKN